MKGIQFAIGVIITLAVLSVLATWTRLHVQDDLRNALQRGIELALPWRVALALANWFVRLEPWLAMGGVGIAALLGALFSRGCTIAEERRALLAWLLIAGGAVVADAAFWAVVGTDYANPWAHTTALAVGAALVAMAVSVVLAVHLQSRLRALGSRIAGWQVGAAVALLAIPGPLVLLPPIAVWVYSGRVQFLRGEAGA